MSVQAIEVALTGKRAIDKGTLWERTIRCRYKSNGQPVNFTGKTPKAQIRTGTDITSTLITDIVVSHNDSGGDIYVKVDDTARDIEHDYGYWDLLMIDDVTGKPDKYFLGPVELRSTGTDKDS